MHYVTEGTAERKVAWGSSSRCVSENSSGARALGFNMRPCTGDSSQQSAVTNMGKGAKKEWGYMYQFSSVTQSCLTLCDPTDHSMPSLPVHHHQLLESTQTHVRGVGDAIQPSHPLSSPSPPALNLSKHQGLFQWVSSSHHVVKLLELQLQHQTFQWIFRTDFL